MTESSREITAVATFLTDLQRRICAALEVEDGTKTFRKDAIARDGGGSSTPCVLEGGAVIERAAVNFSHTRGVRLPAAATERRKDLEGADYEAASLSLIVHPTNPYAPTTHANFRCFRAARDGATLAAWFGGGFDLTPYYGFDEDCRLWHSSAKAACDPFGPGLYARFKESCDRYFFLKHRGEPRGIGGVFFDDFDAGGFDDDFALTKSIAEAFLPTYRQILSRRKSTPYGERERQWQLYRRGRYVEFNLLYDRGTRFGLEAGARTESVLASMPPLVRFAYDLHPEPNTPEARLLEHFLVPRDWIE